MPGRLHENPSISGVEAQPHRGNLSDEAAWEAVFMRFLGEHLEFDAVHLLKLLSVLVGEVDPREVKILGKVLSR
jgi:hypothetical protein